MADKSYTARNGIDESLAKRLTKLGLSETEAQAYLTVLAFGEATMTKIAEETGLSRSYVYDLMKSLDDRGFVEINDYVTPTKVRAQPPDQVTSSLKDEIDDISARLTEHWTSTNTEPLGIEIHKTRSTVVNRLRALIEEAEGEVLLSIPGPVLSEVEDELRAAFDRGVMILLFFWRTEPDELSGDGFDGLASVVRASPYWGPTLLTIDFDRAGLLPPAQIFVTPQTDFQAIEAREPMPVYVMRSTLIVQEWPVATEVYQRDPVDLPWEGRWFSSVTMHATQHLEAGTDLFARIEGRPIDQEEVKGAIDASRHGEFETFEARMVGTRQYLLDPLTNTRPVENCLIVEYEGREVTIGGTGAYLEDYEARLVQLDTSD